MKPGAESSDFPLRTHAMSPIKSTSPDLGRADELLEALTNALGADSVLTGDAIAGRHFADWSDAPAELPVALLLPRTPEQVALALRICHLASWPVTVQGGLTGLAGGANPRLGEVALSLARLNAIENLDALGGTAVVQAGVTLEQLHAAATECGWFFPLDLGARGSCQLGGNAATNAGGNLVVRYGMMRQSILGLEVALADGTLLTMLDRMIKNNAGFDLKQLFIGSEGTLGVITRLSLKLEPARSAKCTALCGVRNFETSSLLLRKAKAQLPELTAFELMWQDFFETSAATTKRSLPFDKNFPLYVLIETHAHSAEAANAALECFLGDALEANLVEDAILAQSVEQATQLWGYREAVSELLTLAKPCAAFDVSVALPCMEGLVDELRETLRRCYPERQHLFFGHLGDGNLHLISGPYPRHEDLAAVEALVYQQVGRHGGSISAEHGIGVVKKGYLQHTRSAGEVALMTGLKRLLDPCMILNPGRVFEIPSGNPGPNA